MAADVDPAWRSWVRLCVLLGAWLALTSVFWLALLVRAVAREGALEVGSGPPALAGLLALADVALVGNLGRWWLRPRWPGRAPRGWWPTWTDPLRRSLPAVTGGVLVANLVLVVVDSVGIADWASLALIVVGLVLLVPVMARTPKVGPEYPRAAR